MLSCLAGTVLASGCYSSCNIQMITVIAPSSTNWAVQNPFKPLVFAAAQLTV